jgi:Holliday junction resolvase RusA-like endonuclease
VTWTPLIEFTVTGTPVGKPRARARAVRVGSAVFARVYDGGEDADWKGDIVRAAMPLRPAERIESAVCVDIDFLFPRPKSLLRKKDPAGEMPHTKTPDRDNCEKLCLDALTRLGFWLDDCQVCDGTIRKFYVSKTGLPGARVRISVPAVEQPLEIKYGDARKVQV